MSRWTEPQFSIVDVLCLWAGILAYRLIKTIVEVYLG